MGGGHIALNIALNWALFHFVMLAMNKHSIRRSSMDHLVSPLVQPVLDEISIQEAVRYALKDVKVVRVVKKEVG